MSYGLSNRKKDVVRVSDLSVPKKNLSRVENVFDVIGNPEDDPNRSSSMMALLKRIRDFAYPEGVVSETTVDVDETSGDAVSLYELNPADDDPTILRSIKVNCENLTDGATIARKETVNGETVTTGSFSVTAGTVFHDDLNRATIEAITYEITSDAGGAETKSVGVNVVTSDASLVLHGSVSVDESVTDEQDLFSFDPSKTSLINDAVLELSNITEDSTIKVYEKLADGGDYLLVDTISFTQASESYKTINLGSYNEFGFKMTITPGSGSGSSVDTHYKLGVDYAN